MTYLQLNSLTDLFPALLGDADDVIGFVVFIIIGAVMLVFKALATARSNAQKDGSSRQQIAQSIRAKRAEIQERAAETRRERMVATAPPDGESPQERRMRLRHERLLQRQGRAADARTEYDLIRQRRQQQEPSPTESQPAPVHMQNRPVRASVPASPLPPKREVAPVSRPTRRPGPTPVPRAAQPLQGTTAPVTSSSVADGARKRSPKASQSLAHALRRRMRGNQLREFLVAAEVLGKPVSLRAPDSSF